MDGRVAILVGNAQFEPDSGLEPLKFPPKDVKELAEVLRDPNAGRFDQVIEVIDESFRTDKTRNRVSTQQILMSVCSNILLWPRER